MAILNTVIVYDVPGLLKTASGSVIAVSDALAKAVKSLDADINAVQNLNGYDSPWPAGGGKNKFDVSKMVNTSDITINNGVISVTGNAKNSGKKLSELADLIVGETYILTANTTGTENIIYLYGTGANVSWTFGTSKTITQEMLDALVMFYGGANTTSQISNFMIRLASVTDATYAPYSNICPISGWSNVKVTRTGKNLYEPTVTEYKDESGASFNGYNITSLVTFLNTLPIGTYNVSFKFDVLETVSGATSWGILLRNSVSGYIDGRQNGQHNSGETLSFTRSITITAENKGQFVNAYLYSGGGNKAKVYWYDFQLELGSPATAYEPYNGNTYTIQLGQTVYGGSLDVTTGVLTVDREIIDLSSLSWELRASGLYRSNVVSDLKTPPSLSDNVDAIAEKYAITSYTTLNNDISLESIASNLDGRLFVGGGNSGTGNFVYKLDTPQTVQLSPTTVRMLVGNNTLWANSGDSELVYWASQA